MATETIAEQFAALRRAYGKALPARIKAIMAWRSRLRGPGDVQTLVYLLHAVAGGAATFGYEALGAAARDLEAELQRLGDRLPASWSGAQRKAIDEGFEALQAAAALPPRAVDEPALHLPVRGPLRSVGSEDRRILLVDDAELFSEDLKLQLECFGYEVRHRGSLKGLARQIAALAPDVIVMDIIFPEGERAGLEAVQRLRKRGGELPPVIFLSERDDLPARLDAVRGGGVAYFTKPVDVTALVDSLDALTLPEAEQAYRVMIVDDDHYCAEYAALLLQQVGMETRVVGDPLQIQLQLRDFQPELILMDLYLSGCDGLELSAVVRQQPSYVGVPIVFLSVETDVERHLEAMRAGGDDFLLKPVAPSQLIAVVEARIKRARAMNALMMRDSLTGLLNHSTIKEQLAREMARVERFGGAMAYALLDLDDFKAINDSYGHIVGDHVIVNLARLLRQRLRRTDIVGRYGGEEFAVIFADTDCETAVRIVDGLRRDFARIQHRTDGREFTATLSAGVAGYAPGGSADTLCLEADKALYRAKAAGRNRVVAA